MYGHEVDVRRVGIAFLVGRGEERYVRHEVHKAQRAAFGLLHFEFFAVNGTKELVDIILCRLSLGTLVGCKHGGHAGLLEYLHRELIGARLRNLLSERGNEAAKVEQLFHRRIG